MFLSYYFQNNTQHKNMKTKPQIYQKKAKKTLKLTYFAIILAFLTNFFCIFPNQKILLCEEGFYYTDNVEHLFTHCLIAYPNIAFNQNNHMAKHYMADCITANEFVEILHSLYNNNYVLVNINDCFKLDDNGLAVKNKIKVPIGKKPLIFSFDDVNYDSKKIGLGMVDKIILDKNNNFASSTIINNKINISYDNEFIPILENFVNQNPDFSINNAKGVINLTGYDGILGYRTSHTNKVNRQEEIENAKRIVNQLKQNGWQFACHSYGHYHMSKISTEKFSQEIALWQNEVEPLIGKTRIYVYPYGEWQVFENGEICEKHKLLQDAGFKLFCGVGMRTYYSYLPNSNHHKVLFMDRKCVDGNTLQSNNQELFSFFNPLLVLDKDRK